MSQMSFCPNCGDPVDPSDEDVVNGSHEPHGDSGYYHGSCRTRVLERTHDSEAFEG